MRGKHIIVAVSAGIAAYKAIEVVSRLRKKGAEVKVVMTQNSTHIASPLTFGEISGHPVAIDMFEQVPSMECGTYCISYMGRCICGCSSYGKCNW